MHDTLAYRKSVFVAQCVISGYEQHSVTRGDTEQRYESDDGRNAHLTRCKHKSEHSANERKRQVKHYHATLKRILELHVEQQEYNNNTHQRRYHQRTAG